MKRILFAIALATAPIAVAGCETIPNSTHATLTDEKALYAAEAAFQGVLISVNAAVDSGALKGANATKARETLEKARAALLIARRTKATADAFTVLNYAADLKGSL